jgi:AbrB family looped-hinge helix DNA binding protein
MGKETYLQNISPSGRSGEGQHVLIPPEVREKLGTKAGDMVRVTIEKED